MISSIPILRAVLHISDKGIKVLSQTSIYAIRAMGYLASESGKDEKPILGRIIAEEMQIPANFLSKILNRLVQARLIRSTRGPNGGFVMNRPTSDIYVREVIDLFMQLDDFKDCFLRINKCDGTCSFHIRWRIITDQMGKILDEVTVDKILKKF